MRDDIENKYNTNTTKLVSNNDTTTNNNHNSSKVDSKVDSHENGNVHAEDVHLINASERAKNIRKPSDGGFSIARENIHTHLVQLLVM